MLKRTPSKGRVLEEEEKEKRKRAPSKGRMGAESRSIKPAAAASGSRASSRAPSTALERQMKLVQATGE